MADEIKRMEPEGLKQSPMIHPEIEYKYVFISRVNLDASINDSNPFTIWSIFMNTDKVTTIAGSVAALCAGVIGAGVLVPATTIYIAVCAIGTISGGIFAWFTNKPSPFVKPEDKK